MAWIKHLLLVGVLSLGACATETTGIASMESDPVRAAESHTNLASGYYNMGRYKIALEEATEAIEINDEYAPAYNVLGLIYMALRDEAEAAENFRKALKLAPADSDINHNYGVFLCQSGKTTESVEYFMKAAKNPLYAHPERSLGNAGRCLRKSNREPEAKLLFERALLLQPQDGLALYNLADIAYRNEDFLPARAYLQRLSRRDQTPDALLLAWRVERALGDSKAEKRIADQLIRDFPTSDQAKQLR